MNRFRGRVDTVLSDAFPADLRINGVPVIGASGPGGRVVSEYKDGGESTGYRFPFRLPITSVDLAPVVGAAVDWVVDASTTLRLEVMECSRRPHEDRFALLCKNRRV